MAEASFEKWYQRNVVSERITILVQSRFFMQARLNVLEQMVLGFEQMIDRKRLADADRYRYFLLLISPDILR